MIKYRSKIVKCFVQQLIINYWSTGNRVGILKRYVKVVFHMGCIKGFDLLETFEMPDWLYGFYKPKGLIAYVHVQSYINDLTGANYQKYSNHVGIFKFTYKSSELNWNDLSGIILKCPWQKIKAAEWEQCSVIYQLTSVLTDVVITRSLSLCKTNFVHKKTTWTIVGLQWQYDNMYGDRQ